MTRYRVNCRVERSMGSFHMGETKSLLVEARTKKLALSVAREAIRAANPGVRRFVLREVSIEVIE